VGCSVVTDSLQCMFVGCVHKASMCKIMFITDEMKLSTVQLLLNL